MSTPESTSAELERGLSKVKKKGGIQRQDSSYIVLLVATYSKAIILEEVPNARHLSMEIRLQMEEVLNLYPLMQSFFRNYLRAAHRLMMQGRENQQERSPSVSLFNK
jgi:hypothetical protein